jgi:RNA polymerase sigma-70 factor (ECF subfamily)
VQVSDDAAVAGARSGDREAFRTLVERHSRYLYGVAYRMTGNAEDARDVVQETWLKAHSQLGRFEARANLRTWLTRIAINCAIDYIRKTRRHEAPVDVSADGRSWHEQPTLQPLPDRLVLAGEIGTRIEGTMRCLTTLERAAFVLRHVEGMSIDEIGTALGLNTSATKHSIFRAVRKMRVALAPFKEA